MESNAKEEPVQLGSVGSKEISIFSLWRDSEKTIHRSLSQLEDLESENDNVKFSYFFYENDSKDNTRFILKEWMSKKTGILYNEDIGTVKYGSTMSNDRLQKMAYYRNKVVNLARYITTDFSMIFDSDVIFDRHLISRFLSKIDEETVMYTPFVEQNIKCKMCNCGRDSYYDVACLFDSNNTQGLHWSCNPFANVFDRMNFAKGNPVSVNSAFGSCAFFKSDALNYSNWDNEFGLEHISFCKQIKRFGKIKVYSDIKVQVELSKELLEKYGK